MDAMDEDPPSQNQRVRSTVTAVRKSKGRGFRDERPGREELYGGYEGLDGAGTAGPLKSVEGWVVFVSGVHEEASEEDLHDHFADCGDVKNIYLNLDRRTGFVKGYAMVEYAQQQEAQQAVNTLNDKDFMTQPIQVTWAFSPKPLRREQSRARR